MKFCRYCSLRLSTQSSYNRHLDSSIHRHNIQNPYHALSPFLAPQVLLDLVWDFTYEKQSQRCQDIVVDEGRLLDYLEAGYLWKVEDLIIKKNMRKFTLDPPKLILQRDCSPRRVIVWINEYGHKNIDLHAGDYHYHVDILDVDYVWSKLKDIKRICTKVYSFDTRKDQSIF